MFKGKQFTIRAPTMKRRTSTLYTLAARLVTPLAVSGGGC